MDGLHLQLRDLVGRLGYPVAMQGTVLSQLQNACMTYRLKPVVVPDPTWRRPAVPGVAPQPTQNIICLQGKLTITVQNKGYQTPIQIYVLLSFPFVFPLVYVRPYPGAILRPNHPFVDSKTGFVDLSSRHLPPGIWRPNENTIGGILMRLQAGFSQAPPLQIDPKHAEHRRQVGNLTHIVQQRMQEETTSARREFLELQGTLRGLRASDVSMSMNIRQRAAESGGNTGMQLAAVREGRMRIQGQSQEYGVETGDEEITLENLLRLSAGHPLRDERDDLEIEDKALSNTLEAISIALEEKLISMDVFLRQTKALATKQYHVRARMVQVGAEINAMIEAEEANVAQRASSSGGGAGSGAMRVSPPSSFLASGVFRASHVTRGAAPPPPPPGPPVRVPTGSR